MTVSAMALQKSGLAAEIRETALALKMALVEIHPVVESGGMSAASELVGRMKKEVDEICERVDTAQTLCGRDGDIDSLASELAGRITMADPSEMDNRQLLEALMAAELFVMRGRKYLHLRRYGLLAQGAGDGVAIVAG